MNIGPNKRIVIYIVVGFVLAIVGLWAMDIRPPITSNDIKVFMAGGQAKVTQKMSEDPLYCMTNNDCTCYDQVGIRNQLYHRTAVYDTNYAYETCSHVEPGCISNECVNISKY